MYPVKDKDDLLLAAIQFFFRYDPETGVITQADGTPPEISASAPVGDLFTILRIGDEQHRLALKHIAWFLGTGEWTDTAVVCKNDDKSDLRLANLVQRTRSELSAGVHKQRTPTTSKYKGVSWRNDRKTWRVTIVKGGRQHYLGDFDSEDLAANVYNAAAIEIFGEHARLNPCPPRALPTLARLDDLKRKVATTFSGATASDQGSSA